MSDNTIAALVTVLLLAGLVAWVPFLEGCAACHRRLRPQAGVKAAAARSSLYLVHSSQPSSRGR